MLLSLLLLCIYVYVSTASRNRRWGSSNTFEKMAVKVHCWKMTLKAILEQEITPKSLRNHILHSAPRKGTQK